jgi:hypothetical protein
MEEKEYNEIQERNEIWFKEEIQEQFDEIQYEIVDECSFEHPETKKQYKHIWVKFPNDEISENYTDEIFLKDKKEFDVLNMFITNNKGFVYAKISSEIKC